MKSTATSKRSFERSELTLDKIAQIEAQLSKKEGSPLETAILRAIWDFKSTLKELQDSANCLQRSIERVQRIIGNGNVHGINSLGELQFRAGRFDQLCAVQAAQLDGLQALLSVWESL